MILPVRVEADGLEGGEKVRGELFDHVEEPEAILQDILGSDRSWRCEVRKEEEEEGDGGFGTKVGNEEEEKEESGEV